MVGMLFADILDAEVVDYEDELDGAPSVSPESGRRWSFEVAGGVEAFAEEVVGKFSGLRKAVGTPNDLEIHPPLAFVGGEVVFVAEFLGNVCVLDADVLLSFHFGRLQVEVTCIEACKLRARAGEHAVQHQLEKVK